jgi:thymidylate synthase (FAD)
MPANSEIPVLDKGYVRLVDSMGSDLSVVRAARVSHDAAWRAGEDTGSDKRLIKYLWKNRHTSPFEHVTFTFEVKAPIFIFRQWHRHRTWSFNEVSARYKELDMGFFVPDPVNIGVQALSNKQGRQGIGDIHERNLQVQDLKDVYASIEQVYKYLLDCGWPRELARTVLPVGSYSAMFATVDLLNLFKFIELRADPHAQYEIQEYARALLKLVTPIVPVCTEVFLETNNPNPKDSIPSSTS